MKPKLSKFLGSSAIVSGAVGATLFASCCAAPIALSLIGLGSSGLAFFAAEYRLPLLIASVIALGIGASLWWRTPSAATCSSGQNRERGRKLFAGVAIVSTLLIGFTLGKLNSGEPPAVVMVKEAPAKEAPLASVAVATAPLAKRLQVRMPVSKMICAPCAAPVKAALEERFSVTDWSVDIPAQIVVFSVARADWSTEEALKIVQSLGFTASAPEIRPMREESM